MARTVNCKSVVTRATRLRSRCARITTTYCHSYWKNHHHVRRHATLILNRPSLANCVAFYCSQRWSHYHFRDSERFQSHCHQIRGIVQQNRWCTVVPRSRSNGPHRSLGQYEQLLLLRIVLDSPGIYLYEIQRERYYNYGFDVSTSTICRTLRSMGCSRQRIQHIVLQRSEECRARFMAEISMYDPSMLVWIDETGCDRRNSLRRYGYSIRGMPPRDYRLLIHGTRYSAIPVLSLQGIHDVQIMEGTVNGEKFAHFIENTVIPILNPFDETVLCQWLSWMAVQFITYRWSCWPNWEYSSCKTCIPTSLLPWSNAIGRSFQPSKKYYKTEL